MLHLVSLIHVAIEELRRVEAVNAVIEGQGELSKSRSGSRLTQQIGRVDLRDTGYLHERQ